VRDQATRFAVCGDATRWRPWSLRTTCGPDASLGCRDLVSALVAPLLEYLPSLGAAPAAVASAPWTTVDMQLAELVAHVLHISLMNSTDDFYASPWGLA
jgi:hypothetical protein